MNILNNGSSGQHECKQKTGQNEKKNAPEEYKYNNNGRNNNIMQKIKLKESCFEEVPMGMMCIYPVSKLKLSQQIHSYKNQYVYRCTTENSMDREMGASLKNEASE